MATKSKSKPVETAWRFYRSNLATIVWDPNLDKVLADFSTGTFITEDPKVAKKIRELGYPEIPLDATSPPPDIIIQQPAFAIDGDVPIMGKAVGEKLMEQKMKLKTKQVGDPAPQAPVVKAETPKAKASKAKQEAPKKKLRRRKKTAA